MDCPKMNYLAIKISNIQFFDQIIREEDQMNCKFYLNDEYIQEFDIKDPKNQANIPLIAGTDKISLVLQTKEQENIIGCVSFLSQIFFPFKGQSFIQWITLFDSQEDDEFDGDIGVDDEEFPRALFNFTIKSIEPSSMSLPDLKAKSLVAEENQFFGNKIEAINEINKEEIYNKISENIMDQNIPNSEKSFVMRNETFSQEKKAEEISKNFGTDSQPKLETKIIELIQQLKIQKISADLAYSGNQSQEFKSMNISERNFEDLLQLEKEKTKAFEVNLKQIEHQLLNAQQSYHQLEHKSQTQYQKILEQYKLSNKENYSLKQKIINLENQINFYKENSSMESGESSKKLKCGIDDGKNLPQQNDNAVLMRLQLELSNALQINVKNSDIFKTHTECLKNEIKLISSQKRELERQILSLRAKDQVLEAKYQIIERDLKMSQNETKKLKQQIEEYDNLNLSFRQTIDELINKKDKEIMCFKNKVDMLQTELEELKRENDFLAASNQNFEQKINILKVIDYGQIIESLQTNLTLANDENKKLRNHIEKIENTDSFRSIQQKNLMEVNTYNQSKGIGDEQVSPNDLLKFQINELQIQLNEIENVKQTNDLLKKNIEVLQDENNRLRAIGATTQNRLFVVAEELVKQTNITIEQNNIIANLNQQMQILDDSLKNAFDNIEKLQTKIELQKTESNQTPFEKSNSDELDLKLQQYFSQNMIPIKFIKIDDGLYNFGSKRVRLQVKNERITVRFFDGNMNLEEFIRLYAHQELLKTGTSGTSNHYKCMEQERIPEEAKDSQVIIDVDEEYEHRSKRRCERPNIETVLSNNSTQARYFNNPEDSQSIRNFEIKENLEKSPDETTQCIVLEITPQGYRTSGIQAKVITKPRFHSNDEKAETHNMKTFAPFHRVSENQNEVTRKSTRDNARK